MRTRLGCSALTSVLLVGGNAAAAGQTKLAVLPAQFEESARGLAPSLFDDYLLTAAQNRSGAEVIGQDDINALLGFDKQKALAGCDDVTCMADIGGALGVDKLIIVKIARLGEEWITTAKLINIREARVDARASKFVRGDVKALLTAVPALIDKLFGGAQAAVETQAPAIAPAPGPAQPTTQTAGPGQPARPPLAVSAAVLKPDARLGRGSRVTGIVLTSVGLAVVAVASYYMVKDIGDCSDFWGSCADERVGVIGGLSSAAGLGLAGIGTGLYVNGRARAESGDGDATGRVWFRAIGWPLLGLAGTWPMLAAVTDDPEVIWGGALAVNAAAALVFVLSMRSSSGYAVTSSGGKVPFASLTVLRAGDHLVPAAALSFVF